MEVPVPTRSGGNSFPRDTPPVCYTVTYANDNGYQLERDLQLDWKASTTLVITRPITKPVSTVMRLYAIQHPLIYLARTLVCCKSLFVLRLA